jgi:hypothetical protein
LVLEGGAGLVVAGQGKAEGSPVGAERGVEVPQQHRFRLLCSSGFLEPLQGDPAELPQALGLAQLVAVGTQAEAVLEPVLGLVQVV